MKTLYEAKIKTLGPVFVGSGQTLRKSQYIYEQHKKVVGIVNETALVDSLLSKGRYDDFIQQVTNEKWLDLRTCLAKYRMDYESLVSYRLPVNPGKDDRKKLNDLQMFVRNGLNEAYIPGSSIKGALRTCLLAKVADDTKDNKMFESLSVSDSEAISNKGFEIYQKIDYITPNKQPNTISTFRECVKPGVVVRCTISFDEDVLTIEQIKREIRDTYIRYHNNWAAKIRSPQVHPNMMGERVLMYLGGGAGFVSKTLHYKEKEPRRAREDVLAVLRKKYKTYKEIKNPQNVPMAVKLAPSKQGDLELGLCEITFTKKV